MTFFVFVLSFWFVLFCLSGLSSKEKKGERKGLELSGWGIGQDLGGVEGSQVIVY